MQDSYEAVIEKMMSSRRFTSLPGVEVAARMLAALGLDGMGCPYVHVAGTNGKGSVCAFLDAIFRESGRRTGRFISPHLSDFRERITVDGEMISKEDVVRLAKRLFALDIGVTPTMFDYCLMLAVLYFKEQRCEIAVIETGLGGRLDATNALGRPKACVITRIGYDHTAILGEQLAAIASEKAGILKEGVPAVFAGQSEEAMHVLRTFDRTACVITQKDLQRAASYKPGLPGAYQFENAATAEAAARLVLAPDEYACIPAGIRKARWPGRMEILSESPFFMVDGAHNSTGVFALKESLGQMYPGEKFHFVMGVMTDKDYAEMVDQLIPAALDFVTVTIEDERALRGEELAKLIRSRGIPAKSIQDIREVRNLPVCGARTVALGSLYFIGELKRLWEVEVSVK